MSQAVESFETDVLSSYDHVSWAILDRKGKSSAFVSSFDGCTMVGVVNTDLAQYLQAWNIESGQIMHKYRMPFNVLSAMEIPIVRHASTPSTSPLYLLSAVTGNALFLLDLLCGTIRSLRCSDDYVECNTATSEEPVWMLQNEANAASSDTNQVGTDDFEQLRTFYMSTYEVPGELDQSTVHPTNSAFLILNGTGDTSDSAGEPTTLFVASHDPTQPGRAALLHEVSVTNTGGALDTVSFQIRHTAPLDLPCRVQGMGVRGDTLYIIGDQRQVLLFRREHGSLQCITRCTLATSTSMPRYLDHRHAAVFLIHKPLGCLSSALDNPTHLRGTVYEWAGKAGFPTNLGLVGRLDGDTSGLMVFTNDGLLNDRLLRPLEDAAALHQEQYDTTTDGVEGQLPAAIDAVYKSKEYVLRLLQGRNRYCLREDGTLDIAQFEEEFGKPLVFNRCNSEFNVREAQITFIRRYQDPELNPHERADMGWVIEVQVVIHEGKHKQIRRLAKRAGYHVVSLCRTKICGGLLNLDTLPQPGDCRWLRAEEKTALYKALRLL